MVDISRKTYERNGVETIDSDGILWLNKKHIEKGLDHKMRVCKQTKQNSPTEFYTQRSSNQSNHGLWSSSST